MINIITIFLGVTVERLPRQRTSNRRHDQIVVLGLFAFAISTAGGLLGKLMSWWTKVRSTADRAAGVSAVPGGRVASR